VIPIAGIALGICLLALFPGDATGATIEGQIVHPTRRDAAGGIDVFLLGVTRGGEPREDRTRTDERGRFSFPGLPDDAAYILGATYNDISFSGPGLVIKPGETRAPPVTFHVYDRTDDPSGVKLGAVRWTIEREAATYRVKQILEIHNETMKAVVVEADAPPVVRAPLMKGHGGLEALFDQWPAGLEVKNGAVEMRGPLPPGDREYRFEYDLPMAGDGLSAEISLDGPLEEVGLLVRDFGVRIEVEGLHPARPVRGDNQMYLRYVGFDLPAGARIPVEVTPLPPPPSTPRWLHALLQMSLAGVLALVVGMPIDRQTRVTEEPEEEPSNPERAALASALRDLEFDYETGKLSAEDRDRLREELRRETARALAQHRSAESAAPAACACGRAPSPGDRFCAACGTEL
jgi:hypothetical protein